MLLLPSGEKQSQNIALRMREVRSADNQQRLSANSASPRAWPIHIHDRGMHFQRGGSLQRSCNAPTRYAAPSVRPSVPAVDFRRWVSTTLRETPWRTRPLSLLSDRCKSVLIFPSKILSATKFGKLKRSWVRSRQPAADPQKSSAGSQI